VVRVPDYRSRVPGLIPGAAIFSEKYISTVKELLGRSSSSSSPEIGEYGHGDSLC
jgi:hypothetical protein